MLNKYDIYVLRYHNFYNKKLQKSPYENRGESTVICEIARVPVNSEAINNTKMLLYHLYNLKVSHAKLKLKSS